MKTRDALREGTQALRASGTPFLDASLLLADLLSIDRGALLALYPDPLSEAELEGFRRRIARRATGLPVAYILGRKEFWGRSFRVDERVLVPRPDTEILVEAALAAGDEILANRAREAGGGSPAALRLHECCCGSLCVTISLAADRPDWEVSASDISVEALQVAAANAEALLDPSRPGGACRLYESDLFAGVPGGFDLVLANPPYVPSREVDALLAQGWSEPRLALDGGVDGLDLYRALVPQAVARLARGGRLLVEADGSQAPEILRLFADVGLAETRSLPDLSGSPRVMEGRIPW